MACKRVWGSNLHSSTQVRDIIRKPEGSVQQRSTAAATAREPARTPLSGRAFPRGGGCWHGPAGTRAACSAVTRMGSWSFTVVTTWPRWRSGVRGAADRGLTLAVFADGQPAPHRASTGAARGRTVIGPVIKATVRPSSRRYPRRSPRSVSPTTTPSGPRRSR
jgi:hypothetical protein